MRALGASFYLLSVAIGTYMAGALNIIIAAAAKDDVWVADNPMVRDSQTLHIPMSLSLGLSPRKRRRNQPSSPSTTPRLSIPSPQYGHYDWVSLSEQPFP
jgi:hypothetical protein